MTAGHKIGYIMFAVQLSARLIDYQLIAIKSQSTVVLKVAHKKFSIRLECLTDVIS